MAFVNGNMFRQKKDNRNNIHIRVMSTGAPFVEWNSRPSHDFADFPFSASKRERREREMKKEREGGRERLGLRVIPPGRTCRANVLLSPDSHAIPGLHFLQICYEFPREVEVSLL